MGVKDLEPKALSSPKPWADARKPVPEVSVAGWTVVLGNTQVQDDELVALTGVF